MIIGNSCGLAALCMALNILGLTCDKDLTLRTAQDLNFTKQGEMFSGQFTTGILITGICWVKGSD